MSQEHGLLTAYRKKWIGTRVKFTRPIDFGKGLQTFTGVVNGVGDDGARCDGDMRRRMKPNGILFVKLDDGREEDVLDYTCTII